MLGSYDKVLVDEGQDMNRAQIILAMLLLKEGGTLSVIGDDLQAIYGFRGAWSSALHDLARERNAQILPLNITYRCPQTIVKLAQRYAPDFVAADEAPEGEVFNNTTERHMLEQAGPGDFILCRANAPLMSICLKLIAQGKRAYMAGRDVGQELLGILRKLQGRKAFQDMADMEARIANWLRIETEKAQRSCKNPESAERRIEALEDKANIFHALAEGLEDPREVETALNNLFCDPEKTSKDFICCSTVHRSKGLESDNVFILAQGFNRAGAEENNIRYVAITRAKKRLYAVGFAFEGTTPDDGAKEPEEAFNAEYQDRMALESVRDEEFEPHKLESDKGETVWVECGDLASKFRVAFGLVANGTADSWAEVATLLDSWLPGREWKVDGTPWVRSDLFASAQKHVPKAFAASSEAL